MTPGQLMTTTCITDATQRRDVERLVEELGRELDRERAVADSCRRLLAQSDAPSGSADIERLQTMAHDAELRGQALLEPIGWGKALLQTAHCETSPTG